VKRKNRKQQQQIIEEEVSEKWETTKRSTEL